METVIIVHTTLPEEQMVTELYARSCGLPVENVTEVHLPRNDYNVRLLDWFNNLTCDLGRRILLLGNYATVDTLRCLCICMRGKSAGLSLVVWDKARCLQKYQSVFDEHSDVLTLLCEKDFQHAPPWALNIAGVRHETPEAKYLYRGIIHQAKCSASTLRKTYADLLDGKGPGRLELQTSGGVIYEHERLSAEEVVGKQGLHLVTNKGTRVCVSLAPFISVGIYVEVALKQRGADGQKAQIGAIVRYGYDPKADQVTTYISFQSDPEDKHILDFVDTEPFFGGGQPTFRGCNFRDMRNFSEIVADIKQHA